MKYFFGVLAFIAAIVVVILLATNLMRGLNDTNTNTNVTKTVDLTDVALKDSVVRYTMSGAINADENHREIRITISKNARTVEVLKGYNGTVEKTVTLPNNENAYLAFLNALSAASFSNKRDDAEGDPNVTCVTGQRYYYELQSGSDKKVDTWSTTCSPAQGNFGGLVAPTAQLFQSQIPTYAEITRGVSLAAF